MDLGQERDPEKDGLTEYLLASLFAGSGPPSIDFPSLFWVLALSSVLFSAAFGLFTFYANLKYFLFYPSHRIFKRIHGTLNVGKKTN
jgi:hypothetical protein